MLWCDKQWNDATLPETKNITKGLNSFNQCDPALHRGQLAWRSPLSHMSQCIISVTCWGALILQHYRQRFMYGYMSQQWAVGSEAGSIPVKLTLTSSITLAKLVTQMSIVCISEELQEQWVCTNICITKDGNNPHLYPVYSSLSAAHFKIVLRHQTGTQTTTGYNQYILQERSL